MLALPPYDTRYFHAWGESADGYGPCMETGTSSRETADIKLVPSVPRADPVFCFRICCLLLPISGVFAAAVPYKTLKASSATLPHTGLYGRWAMFQWYL